MPVGSEEKGEDATQSGDYINSQYIRVYIVNIYVYT